MKSKQQKWAEANPERWREIRRKSYAKNAEKRRAYLSKYRRDNADKVKEWKQRYYQKHIDTIRVKQKSRYRGIRPKPSEEQMQAKRLHSAIAAALRKQMCKAIRRGQKTGSTIELLGCSIESFRIYIESKFDVGMSWDNYGRYWHLDHIMPCAIFDLRKPEHQRRCFHFSNYQPLTALDNLRKRDRVISDQFNLL